MSSSRRRVAARRAVGGMLLLLVLAAAYSAWLVRNTERDLRAAETAVEQLEVAIRDDAPAARAEALADLQASAEAARSRTGGLWWSAMTAVPVLGDDLSGVEALSASLDLLARGAVEPLLDIADSLDELSGNGRIDLDRLEAVTPTVQGAQEALGQARAVVESQDSAGFAGSIKPRYDEYVERVGDLDDTMSSAELALRVLPRMLGADGPRDYLFIFQNNAEIRATGGIAGSWARIHADNGKLDLLEQGGADDLNTGETVAELTDEELAVYDQLPALFFQDPNFIPDFPRAAELYGDFWAAKYPKIDLDGVLSLDPVAMSYLLEGTGPIEADGVTLTPDIVVDELLSNTYLTFSEPARQDRRFQATARSIFESVTGDLKSPVKFLEGVARAAAERRFLVAPANDQEAAELDGTPVLGMMSADDGATPHVDIGVNDATGSKMSYYLRYRTSVESRSCADGVQQLEGRMTLEQTISPRQARVLPDYITGGGAYGTAPGDQFVTIRIYGPHAGTIADVRLNGEPLNPEYGLLIDGRPVVTVGVLISSIGDYMLTWDMETRTAGDPQDASGRFRVTPGIVPGVTDRAFATSC